jgi:hypothetical protein
VSHIIIHPYAIDTLSSPLEGGLCMVALLSVHSQNHFNLSLLTSYEFWGFCILVKPILTNKVAMLGAG